jgi:hypothetical protein
MLKETIKTPIFTDGFRLIDLVCQSYPYMGGLEFSECSGINLTETNPA